MPKLTKRRVESIKPTEQDVLEWDEELRGFGIRVKPTGVRSYLVQYRNKHGRSRRITIGQHGRLTTVQARQEAQQILARVAQGKDPAEERQTLRKVFTVTDFADRYIDYAKTRKKPGTIETDRINLRCHILPALGRLPLTAVSKADVIRLHQSMKDRPGAANRTVQLLSHMFNVAEKWELRPDGSNPCRHVEKYKERKRERYLSNDELARLGDVLVCADREQKELPSAIAAIRLLIFTGCRRGEILSLKWDHVDIENRCLRLPDSKTGAKTVHLNAAALAVLAGLEHRKDNPFVIVGGKPGASLVNLKKPWQRIRKSALLEDVRIHDLRHSFASIAVGLGVPLPMIGKLLGHTQVKTTHRYAHLAADPVRAANERIGDAIDSMMDGHSAEIVALRN